MLAFLNSAPYSHKRSIHLLWKRARHGHGANVTGEAPGREAGPEGGQDRPDPHRRRDGRHLRHHHRQRRPPHARREAGHLGRDDSVGDDRLPARARHRGAAQRLGPEALRRQAPLDVLPGRVHDRVDRVQPGVERRLAHWLARRPGRRRRPHAPADDHAHLPGRGRQVAGQARHLRRAAGPARPDPRPGDRRRHPNPPELAVHVLGERAVLRRGLAPRLAVPRR